MKSAFIIPIVYLLIYCMPTHAQESVITTWYVAGHYKDTVKPLNFIPIPDKVITTPKEIGRWVQLNCKTDLERLKAIYAWIGTHITYDYESLNNPTQEINAADPDETLRRRMGVCQGYATLFEKIATAAKLQVRTISGYTRVNGSVDKSGGHAWNAVFLNNKWHIIDATWGAGPLIPTDEDKFTWFFFMMPPDSAIRIFIPTDPLFQFLEYPFTHQEIAANDFTHATARNRFAFQDTLNRWSKMNEIDRHISTIARIERFGITNRLIKEDYEFEKECLEVDLYNQGVNGYINEKKAEPPVKPKKTAQLDIRLLYAPADDSSVICIPESVTHSPQAMGQWLKANTPNDYEAVKSLYYWIGNNISYDVVLAGTDKPYKDTIDAAKKTLSTHAGTCQGYTCLFFEVCRQANIPVDLITGYTYVQGQLSTEGSHGWLGVWLNGQWGIIDPTWGAGAVDVRGIFRFYFTWEQFMISPENAIYTHVPFDPIFQYLPHPIKPGELRDHTWEAAANRSAINFEDSIAAYKKQTALEQVKSRMRRMETYGVINQLQRDEVMFLQKSIPAAAFSTDVATGADARFRAAISQYNKLVTVISNKKSWGGTEFLIWSDYRIKECQDILAAATVIRLTFDVSEQNRLNFVKTVNKTLAHLQRGRKDYVEALKKNR